MLISPQIISTTVRYCTILVFAQSSSKQSFFVYSLFFVYLRDSDSACLLFSLFLSLPLLLCIQLWFSSPYHHCSIVYHHHLSLTMMFLYLPPFHSCELTLNSHYAHSLDFVRFSISHLLCCVLLLHHSFCLLWCGIHFEMTIDTKLVSTNHLVSALFCHLCSVCVICGVLCCFFFSFPPFLNISVFLCVFFVFF